MNYIKYFLIFIKENLFFAIFSGGLIYIILPIWKETKNDINDIEDYLFTISSLENMVTGVLLLLIVTIIIFRLNISKFCRDNVAKYKPSKQIIDATERNQIKTKNTIYIWLENIYILIDGYDKKPNLTYKIFKPFYMGRVYCEWLIGFFRFTILGRWIATIFTIYLVLGTYIQQSHQQRLATFSNTVAQAEAFLHDKYDSVIAFEQVNGVSNEEIYYYGSAINLKGALEFLHENKRDLDYLYLPRSQLSRIQLFPKAPLEKAVFSGADLSDSNLFNAQLKEAKLIGADLEEADLRNADLREAKLIGADLYKADLTGADLSKADLNGADLYEANLSGAKLRRTDLNGADLRKANLSGAKLRRTDLSGADLRGSDLTGAELNKAVLSGANLVKAKFKNADMKRTNLKGAVITATDFTGAENLIPEQIMKACWLQVGTYIADGTRIVIKDKDVTPPILPDYLKDFKVHELPEAELKNKNNDIIAYCP